MKLLEAEYISLDGCFTKIRVKIKTSERERKGFFLFENDGCDFEVEGDLDRQEIFDNMESLLYSDEATALLETEIAKGQKAHDS